MPCFVQDIELTICLSTISMYAQLSIIPLNILTEFDMYIQFYNRKRVICYSDMTNSI